MGKLTVKPPRPQTISQPLTSAEYSQLFTSGVDLIAFGKLDFLRTCQLFLLRSLRTGIPKQLPRIREKVL